MQRLIAQLGSLQHKRGDFLEGLTYEFRQVVLQGLFIQTCRSAASLRASAWYCSKQASGGLGPAFSFCWPASCIVPPISSAIQAVGALGPAPCKDASLPHVQHLLLVLLHIGARCSAQCIDANLPHVQHLLSILLHINARCSAQCIDADLSHAQHLLL